MNAPIDITGVELKTERLILRPWRESDLEDLYAYARVDGVGQMAGWLPHRDLDESRRILRTWAWISSSWATSSATTAPAA